MLKKSNFWHLCGILVKVVVPDPHEIVKKVLYPRNTEKLDFLMLYHVSFRKS